MDSSSTSAHAAVPAEKDESCGVLQAIISTVCPSRFFSSRSACASIKSRTHSKRPLEAGSHERRLPVAVRLVHRCARIDQSSRTLVMAKVAGAHERRPPVVGHRVHRCARIDQSLRTLVMAPSAGQHERRPPVVVHIVHRCAHIDQSSRRLVVAKSAGVRERRPHTLSSIDIVTPCDPVAQRLQVSASGLVVQCHREARQMEGGTREKRRE